MHRLQQTAGRGSFVPLSFAPGEAFQFDWSEDFAVIGVRVKLQVAHVSSATAGRSSSVPIRCRPRDAVRRAQSRLSGVGGVPRRGIYDNMRIAVDKVGRGKERSVNLRFQAMTSHYLSKPSSVIQRLDGEGTGREERPGRPPSVLANHASVRKSRCPEWLAGAALPGALVADSARRRTRNHRRCLGS